MIYRLTFLALLIFLLQACDSASTPSADAAPDQAIEDAAEPEASVPPDGPTSDRAGDSKGPSDLEVPDTPSTDDGGQRLLACNKVVGLCENSISWPLYIDPFTPENCLVALSCVTQFYVGVATCDTTFQSLIDCAAGIQTSDECDSKCAADINYLVTTCPCPASCDVPCM